MSEICCSVRICRPSKAHSVLVLLTAAGPEYDQLRRWRTCHNCSMAMDMQDALTASLGTLLEVHNVSMPPPEAHRRPHSPRQQLGLERFGNLRAVTVNEAHHVRDCRLPALPISVRTLKLDAGRGTLRCGPVPDGTASQACDLMAQAYHYSEGAA